MATLLRLSGLLPKEMDIQPLLGDAKRQLHDEADYLREADYLVATASCWPTRPTTSCRTCTPS